MLKSPKEIIYLETKQGIMKPQDSLKQPQNEQRAFLEKLGPYILGILGLFLAVIAAIEAYFK